MLAFSPITLFIRADHILGILKLISFVFFSPQLSYIKFPEENKNEMLNFYFVFFLMGFNSQPGAAGVCDSKAGAELLDILRRKVSLFSFNVSVLKQALSICFSFFHYVSTRSYVVPFIDLIFGQIV